MPKDHPEQLKIYLLEDPKSAGASLSELLNDPSFNGELTPFKHLEDAVEATAKDSPDAFLLDLAFSKSKQRELIDTIRKLSEQTAVIVLLGSRNDSLQEEAMRAGASDFLLEDRLSNDLIANSLRHSIEKSSLRRAIKAHEATLAQNKILLRKIFSINADAILVLSKKYEIKFVNTAAAELLDASEGELIGEIFPFEINPGKTTELEIPDAKGNIRSIELSSDEIVWDGKNSLIVILRDVSQQMNAQLDLQREKERFSVALESVQDAVILTDKEGRIERMNQEACRLTGVSNHDATGQLIGKILRLKNPSNGEYLDDHCSELHDQQFVEGHNKSGIVLVPADEESSHLVSVQMCCVFDEEGSRHGCVTVLRDITKQKIAEEELYKSENLNSVSLMTGGIAHDFNNILTSILGNISIARLRMDENEEISVKLLAAEKAALQAKSLTQQLLTFAKGGVPVKEISSIGELVEESTNFIMRGSNVSCKINRAPDLWHAEVDKGQIAQVVNNLVINADQAMPDGGSIEVILANAQLNNGEVEGLDAGDYVKIEVQDSGSGIPPDQLNKVFEPYFTTKSDGNGLGLASSFSIIKGHGGLITVESELGKGSCFRVYLPRSQNEPTPDLVEEDPVIEEPTHESDDESSSAGKRILVMDDMEDMMMVAAEILKVLGYEVECTSDGSEAIEAYKKAKESGNPFDAVVFDLTVPGGMGGEEASNILLEYDPNLKAIASSGYSTSNIMSDCSESAFSAVVPKPYRITEMADALKRVIK